MDDDICAGSVWKYFRVLKKDKTVVVPVFHEI